MDKRYQHQTFWVKTLRWWRWKPYYTVAAAFAVLQYILRGMPREPIVFPDGFVLNLTRRQVIASIWGVVKAGADIKMNWLYTTEEVLDSITKRLKK